MKRIAHITLQPFENDARVLRSISALEDNGFECTVVAPGHGFDLPTFNRIQKAKVAIAFAIGARLGAKKSWKIFFQFQHYRRALEALLAAQPDAIHAHDWDGLFVGAQAAQKLGVPFVYDSHEFAAHMHSTRKLWRMSVGALIRTLEPVAVREAAFVIGVSEGHVRALRNHLKLQCPTPVIRNITREPMMAAVNKRDAEAPILLHYHGAIARGRGVEKAIEALARLPDRFRLRITGPWLQVGFEAKMRTRMQQLGITNRINIVAPVPHDQLVDHASTADIGICLLPSNSRHNAIALPNKIFDYLKAGLFIIAAGSDELGFLEKAKVALLLENDSADALVDALMKLDTERLDEMKSAALNVASKNEWPAEARKLAEHWQSVIKAH